MLLHILAQPSTVKFYETLSCYMRTDMANVMGVCLQLIVVNAPKKKIALLIFGSIFWNAVA
jgi:hypothetical protein